MTKFELGDWVTWKSQAQGYEKSKTGLIVQVIAPHERPLPKQIIGAGWGRNHESYLVRVDPKPGSKAKPKFYWPRVSLLQRSSL